VIRTRVSGLTIIQNHQTPSDKVLYSSFVHNLHILKNILKIRDNQNYIQVHKEKFENVKEHS